MSEPLIGRPVKEALGLNTRELLAAATNRFCGDVDAEKLLGTLTDEGDGRVARVMEGLFHADSGYDGDEDKEEEGEWRDICAETDTEWEEALKLKLGECVAKGLSGKGKDTLESMLRNNRTIVRVRYNGGPHANVRRLELSIQPNARAVQAKPRRYPPEKRPFFRKYVEQLENLGLITQASNTEWVSAPLFVPKKPPAMYRLTVGYRPVNAATVKNTWPMPHIDAALQDMRGAQAFAAIDFASGYWQLPMHLTLSRYTLS